MRVTVDPEKCLTSGLCVVTDGQVFDQDEASGTAIVLTVSPPPDAYERVRQAAQLCPGQAIIIEEDNDPPA